MPLLFLMFIVVPIVEMMVLIQVGSVIGTWNTIGLVLLTAVVGASLLRKQGLETLLRANRKLNRGEIPAQEMVEGFMLAFGGALLLTPGFITDCLGFVLVIPFFRKPLIRYVQNKLMVVAVRSSGERGSGFYHDPGAFSDPGHRTGDTIDGEFEDLSGKESTSSAGIEAGNNKKN